MDSSTFERTSVTFNPQKKISEDIIFVKIEEYMNAMRQARTGIPNNENVKLLTEDLRIGYQIKAIRYIISSLLGILDICKPSILSDCYDKWKRTSPAYKKQYPFDKESVKKNGYNLIRKNIYPTIRQINVLIRTKKIPPLIKKNNANQKELTLDFFDLLEDFDNIFTKIYVLLIRHNIVSSYKPFSEMTYLELEKKAIDRIKGA